MRLQPQVALVVTAAALATVLSADPGAYSVQAAAWPNTPVPYLINPDNADLPRGATEAAVRAGADVWSDQAGSAFRFLYAGVTSETATTFDRNNIVVFRNAADGSAIATTYLWFNSSGIVDADIVFWDGAFRFFAGSSGCSGGFYVEDVAAHEFGHALGLGHSEHASSTMYPTTSACNMGNRTLHGDDIAGLLFLYPPLAGRTPPQPPKGLRIVG